MCGRSLGSQLYGICHILSHAWLWLCMLMQVWKMSKHFLLSKLESNQLSKQLCQGWTVLSFACPAHLQYSVTLLMVSARNLLQPNWLDLFLTTFLWVQCFPLPYKDLSLNIMLWPCLHLSQTTMTGQISTIPHPPLGVCNSHCKCYFVSGGEFCYLLPNNSWVELTREAYLVSTLWKWWMLPFFYVLFGQRRTWFHWIQRKLCYETVFFFFKSKNKLTTLSA